MASSSVLLWLVSQSQSLWQNVAYAACAVRFALDWDGGRDEPKPTNRWMEADFSSFLLEDNWYI